MRLEQNNAAACARMAKIRLTEEETAVFQRELQELFGWVKQLAEVDVSAVKEAAVSRAAYLRPDEPVSDQVLSGALVETFNGCENSCAKVKKVL